MIRERVVLSSLEMAIRACSDLQSTSFASIFMASPHRWKEWQRSPKRSIANADFSDANKRAQHTDKLSGLFGQQNKPATGGFGASTTGGNGSSLFGGGNAGGGFGASNTQSNPFGSNTNANTNSGFGGSNTGGGAGGFTFGGASNNNAAANSNNNGTAQAPFSAFSEKDGTAAAPSTAMYQVYHVPAAVPKQEL